MGLFDFFKKKEPKEENKEELVEEVAPVAEQDVVEEDAGAPGWDAITEVFEKLYPDQPNPKHYGTLIKYFMGGPDPLDGISIYDAGDFWHFVSFGLSELYTKESENTEYSGFGIEFTFKLKKSGSEDEEDDILSACGNLQKLARYIFETGRVILPNQYVYTQQPHGIDFAQTSALTGFVALADDLLPEIGTPFGKVQFVCLVGATDQELRAIYDKEKTVGEIADLLSSQVTDYGRRSVI